MIILLGVLLVLTTGIYDAEAQTCGPNNIICVSDTTYQFCFVSGTQVVVVDGVKTCPTGTVCNDIDGQYACTTSTSATESATITVPASATAAAASCTAAGTYASGICNQYYECVAVMWWYELVLQTCPSGESYDSATGACVTDSTCVS